MIISRLDFSVNDFFVLFKHLKTIFYIFFALFSDACGLSPLFICINHNFNKTFTKSPFFTKNLGIAPLRDLCRRRSRICAALRSVVAARLPTNALHNSFYIRLRKQFYIYDKGFKILRTTGHPKPRHTFI